MVYAYLVCGAIDAWVGAERIPTANQVTGKDRTADKYGRDDDRFRCTHFPGHILLPQFMTDMNKIVLSS